MIEWGTSSFHAGCLELISQLWGGATGGRPASSRDITEALGEGETFHQGTKKNTKEAAMQRSGRRTFWREATVNTLTWEEAGFLTDTSEVSDTRPQGRKWQGATGGQAR